LRNAAVGPARSRRLREEEDEDDRPWELDGLTSLAHGELDQHREARHYARIAAYEMPRLARNAPLSTPVALDQV
jgi:small subunit ribosomal protein S35